MLRSETLSRHLNGEALLDKEKQEFKTGINYYAHVDGLKYYSNQNSTIIFDLPQDLSFVGDESWLEFDCHMVNGGDKSDWGNTVANNAYTRVARLENAWTPIRRAVVQVGTNQIDEYDQDLATFLSVQYAYVGEDYISTVLKDTGMFNTPAEKAYFNGGSITNADAVGSGDIFVKPLTGVEPNALVWNSVTALAGADVPAILASFNGAVEADNSVRKSIANYINTALQNITSKPRLATASNYKGVNETLGLNLAVNTADATGIAVPVGYRYRMFLPGLLKHKTALHLADMPQVTIKLTLDDFGSAFEADNGAGAVVAGNPQYVIQNLTYFMRKLTMDPPGYNSIVAKLNRGIMDITQGMKYEYEGLFHTSFNWNAGVTTIRESGISVDYDRCKAIFMTFRNQADILSPLCPDSKSGFICPFNPATGSMNYQFILDSEYYPQQPCDIGLKNLTTANSLTIDALGSLDDVWLGTKFPTASFLERGNFIVGMRLKGSELAPAKRISKMTVILNRTSLPATDNTVYPPVVANPTIVVDVFIVYSKVVGVSSRSAEILVGE